MATSRPGLDKLTDSQRIKELLIARATGQGSPDQEREYTHLRHSLVDDSAIAKLVPAIVRQCRSLDEFWGAIKAKTSTYAERRELLRNEFDPLLTFLETSRQAAQQAPAPSFAKDSDAFFSRVVQLLMHEGRAREVAILRLSALSFELTDREDSTDFWCILAKLPAKYYTQLTDGERATCQQNITRAAQDLAHDSRSDWPTSTNIRVDVQARENWREHAAKWLRGEGINNQGRVRTNNMPSREEDGLLFRSTPEVLLYRALKNSGVAFAPLPVFLRGGQSYQRIEPDFVVIKDRAIMVIEVDGDTVHVELPAEADQRTRIFKHEGALIERVRAADCDTPEKASVCVQRLLAGFEKWRRQR